MHTMCARDKIQFHREYSHNTLEYFNKQLEIKAEDYLVLCGMQHEL